MSELRGPRALEMWARRCCSGYNDVAITDMTTAWRSGLAFCAIIHRHRPDLIDYESLSPKDPLKNLRLAFDIAERCLGVPALLDAEDVMTSPDRLCVLTYLAQFYSVFNNKDGAKNNVGAVAGANANKAKVSNAVSNNSPVKEAVKANSAKMTSLNSVSKPSYLPRRDKCTLCKNAVFLAERILVDSKVYHRVCFSCARCGARLNPDSCDYYECESGEYCCESCPNDSIQSSLCDEISQSSTSNSGDQSSGSALVTDERNGKISNQVVPVICIPDSSEESISIDVSRTPKKDSIVLNRMKFFENNLLSGNKSDLSRISDGADNLLNNAMIETTIDSTSDVSDSKKIKFSSPVIISDSDSKICEISDTSKDCVSDDSCMFEDSSVNDLSTDNCSNDPEISVKCNVNNSSNVNSLTKTDEFSCNSSLKESGMSSNNTTYVSLNMNDTSFESYQETNAANHVVTISDSSELPSSVIQEKNVDHIFTSTLASTDFENSKMRNDVSSSFNLGSSFDILKMNSVSPDIKSFSTDAILTDSSSLLNSAENVKEALEINIVGETDVSLPDDLKSPFICENKENKSEIATEDALNDLKNEKFSLENIIESNHDIPSALILQNNSESNYIPSSLNLDNSSASVNEYPEELNPFGEEENTSDLDSSNPFFDDLVDDSKNKIELLNDTQNKSSGKTHQRRKIPVDNPFWSDEDCSSSSDEENDPPVPAPRNITSVLPKASQRTVVSSEISNNGLKSTSPSPSKRKKQPAPAPPMQNSPGKLSTRKTRPAPLPPIIAINSPDIHTSTPMYEQSTELSNCNISVLAKCNISDVKQSAVQHEWDNCKSDKDEDNRTRKSSDGMPNNKYFNNDKQAAGKWKRKKRPAPAMPVTRRSVTPLPIADIKHELEIIELQQQGLEKQGVKLEQMIRLKCEGSSGISDNSCTVGMTDEEVDDLVLQLFEIVNEKNELFRRQAQLMYMRRQQRLEEEHADLEYQIRCLMAQPETNRTDSDKQLEEHLISRLLEVVSMRNEVVDCLEMDRVRAVEEDLSISTRLESYNAQREQNEDTNSQKQNPLVKLSKKEKKKEKEKKKMKKCSKKQDLDKDVDETEISETCKTNKILKDKKKLKWFS